VNVKLLQAEKSVSSSVKWSELKSDRCFDSEGGEEGEGDSEENDGDSTLSFYINLNFFDGTHVGCYKCDIY